MYRKNSRNAKTSITSKFANINASCFLTLRVHGNHYPDDYGHRYADKLEMRVFGVGFAGMPLVANESKFLKPARYADLLQLHSQLTHIGNSSFHMQHQFFKGEDLLVVCKEVRVWTCRTAEEPEKLRASPIPADVRVGLLRSECHTFRLVQE